MMVLVDELWVIDDLVRFGQGDVLQDVDLSSSPTCF